MKSLIEQGIGCTTKQADPILPGDEAKLWDVGVFGKKNAEQLQKNYFLLHMQNIWSAWLRRTS